MISNQADLEQLAKDVNGGNGYGGKYFKVTADITLLGERTPIGNPRRQFYGTFDGDGHKISNLKIKGGDNVGLFGYLGRGGMIKNITLENVDVTGNEGVGGLVGMTWKTVTGNTVNATVSGRRNVGGLVGKNYGTVSDNKYYSNVGGIGIIDGKGEAENNTRYYKFTLPDGVTLKSEPDTFSDGTYTYTVNDDTTITIGNCPKIGNIVFDRATYKYLISSVADLQDFAAYVNAGNSCEDLEGVFTSD